MMPKPSYSADEIRFKDGLTITDLLGVGKVARTIADKLDGYESRGAITHEQWLAGCQFQRDYERGEISSAPSACAYERSEPSHNGPQEGAARAKERWRGASQALGPVGADVCFFVCCENMSAAEWAHARKERKEYGMGRLREALDTLEKHYGI
jgi:hypothetical protein